MELLTVAEMAQADRLAIDRGPFDGFGLMRNAGRAVAQLALSRHGEARAMHVLCGPGNNGGDGYVAAAELSRAGATVHVHALAPPRPGTDAAQARRLWQRPVKDLAAFRPEPGDLVVDALFGAGLARPVEGPVLDAIARTKHAGCPVLAVDLPTGICGDDGRVLGDAFVAAWTVTFFRRKPGHLLFPGRLHCGETIVVDIGIPEAVLAEIRPRQCVNLPQGWIAAWPAQSPLQHKYSRGAVGVLSGGPNSTGAARLSAMAAQRAGAGAVTVFSPSDALAVNACHLTSIMLARLDTADDLAGYLHDGRRRAYVLGPGFGVGTRLAEFAVALAAESHDGLVLDADALTALARQPQSFFAGRRGAPVVLTPHDGEFARLFPDLAGDPALSKLDRARRAAERARAVVVSKGPDTVIASPDGRAAINANATPALATAGSGDVLAGIVAALLARGMPPFEAACASVWIHGEAGRAAGGYAIAEDLVRKLPGICGGLDARAAAN